MKQLRLFEMRELFIDTGAALISESVKNNVMSSIFDEIRIQLNKPSRSTSRPEQIVSAIKEDLNGVC